MVDEEFIEAAVFSEDEGIIETRDQKNVMHFEGHQVFEAFKALFGIHDDDGLVRAAHAHGEYPSPVRGSNRIIGWRAGHPARPRTAASDLDPFDFAHGRLARRPSLHYTVLHQPLVPHPIGNLDEPATVATADAVARR